MHTKGDMKVGVVTDDSRKGKDTDVEDTLAENPGRLHDDKRMAVSSPQFVGRGEVQLEGTGRIDSILAPIYPTFIEVRASGTSRKQARAHHHTKVHSVGGGGCALRG